MMESLGLTDSIINLFIKQGIVVTILLVAIGYLTRKIDKKENELKEVQKTIVELHVNSIEALGDLKNVIELIRSDINRIK